MQHRLLSVLLMLLVPSAAVADARQPSPQTRAAEHSVVRGNEVAPDGYTLSAAYPNPFRTQTSFDLRVDQTQRVSIEVYNILGQRVRTVFEGLMRSEDARSFTLEAGGLPSGLYLYRVTGETFTATRRITLVR